jgi:hypothetical protein
VLALELHALCKSTRDGAAIDREYFDQYLEGRSAGYAKRRTLLLSEDDVLALVR